MDNRKRAWTWLAAAMSFMVGFIVVLSDSGAGWFLIILGTIYIGSTRARQAWAASNPRLGRWGSLGLHCGSCSSSPLLAHSSC